jgi:methyltransferase (TIGR00027 family)
VVQALDKDFAEACKNIEALSSAIMMIIRTRFIEERLAHAIGDGVIQVVILGAGFDTRAYRLTELLQNARVFEVDQPSTQEYKKRRVREAGIAVPPNLTYVAVDFRHDKLGDILTAAGYHSNQKTFFIWEGVTMYLPEAAVEETLRWVAEQTPGSTIIFDFVGAMLIQFMATADLSKFPEAAQKAFERIRRLTSGEPWIFGLPDTKEREFLGKLGLELQALLPVGGEESMKRYLTRSDGTPYIQVAPTQQQAQSQRGGYCLAEAVVPSR